MTEYGYGIRVGSKVNPCVVCKLGLHGMRESHQSSITHTEGRVSLL